MIPIIMPQVGQDYLTGTIVEWLKSENNPVEKGEVVLRVESEKATFDVEADGEGVLLQILHDDGSEVDILKPVGYIGQSGESVPDSDTSESSDVEAMKQETITASAVADSGISSPSKKRNISPAAKSAAEK